jgi:hypothetical protein
MGNEGGFTMSWGDMLKQTSGRHDGPTKQEVEVAIKEFTDTAMFKFKVWWGNRGDDSSYDAEWEEYKEFLLKELKSELDLLG